jgi:hypothetical protein
MIDHLDEVTMMTDLDTAKILSHRRNIQRYCRLLATELTDIERQYLHRRIAEEYAELKRLQSEPVEQVIATQAMVRAAAAQSSAGQVLSMILAPLRRVSLAVGQRSTAAAKHARANRKSFTPARCS